MSNTIPDPHPFVSIVIPTCDRNDLLGRCLECLAPGTQTAMADSYEVIVSDDGAEQTAEEMLAEKFPWARWLRGPRRGPAANRNSGAGHARGSWLLFTDDDCLPDPAWIISYLETISEDPSVAVMEGRVYSDPVLGISEGAPRNEGGLFWTCNLAVEKAAFHMIGGFSEEFPFPSMEDVEFRTRFQKTKIKTQYVASASVYHPPKTIPSFVEHFRRSSASLQVFLKLHPDRHPDFRLFPSAFHMMRWTLNRVKCGWVVSPVSVAKVLPEILLGQLLFFMTLSCLRARRLVRSRYAFL